jgi:hypothetical protein
MMANGKTLLKAKGVGYHQVEQGKGRGLESRPGKKTWELHLKRSRILNEFNS